MLCIFWKIYNQKNIVAEDGLVAWRSILAWQSVAAHRTLRTCPPPAQSCRHAYLSLLAWLGHLVAGEVVGGISRGFPGETLPPAADYFHQLIADDVALAPRNKPTAIMRNSNIFFSKLHCQDVCHLVKFHPLWEIMIMYQSNFCPEIYVK